MKTSFKVLPPLLLLLTLPAVVQAQWQEWQYTFNNTGSLVITRYTGPGGTVTIPDMINVGSVSQPDYVWVTDVGGDAFSGNYPFLYCPPTNIKIGTNVARIGNWAFYDCTSLTAITVDTNNPYYSSLAGVLFGKRQIMLAAYPEGITGSYTIPNSVYGIGDYAFVSCENLTSVTMGANVTSIGEGAFWWCTNLNAVYFEGDAPSLGTVNPQLAFAGDNNLTVYYLPGTTGWVNFAQLTGLTPVLWNPQVQPSGASIGVRTNRFGFTVTGSSNLVIVVEACTNLANPAWSPVGTNTLTGGSSYFSDPQWTNYPARFYRLRSP